ncbi:YncE family protein [Acidobacteria bacterium AB60]|nr:YncE family protein [Acidobacteria bacterium AB60]
MSLSSLRTGQAHVRLVQASTVLLTGALIAGCGAGYRPVVSPINPSGPASQPQTFVGVVSSPSPTAPGVLSVVDYAGDTIMAQAPIGPGPLSFTLDETGSNGYTVNSDGTLTNFQVSSSFQAKNIQYTTLPATANVVNLFTPSAGIWTADLTGNVIDVLTGFPGTFKLAVPVATTPVTIVGPGVVGQRNYAIAQDLSDTTGVLCNVSPRTVTASGEADAIEQASFTVSNKIPLGKCPVYALETPDSKRVFVLNRGDDTITVINSQNNTLDACTPFPNQSGQTVTCHPSLPLSTSAGLTGTNAPAIAGPVYAEYNAATAQLVVADYDGNAVSVIDVSLDIYGNDSPTFGTTYTIPVGASPASVTALFDGSRAYTANQADGTVTEVNLVSHTPIKTLPVNGHPRTVASVQNSLYGKVYVASPDSPYLTIIRTDQDIIDATVLVQGNIVDVRASNQNGTAGNAIVSSRKPGYGQPCYLPPSLLSNSTIQANPSACSTLP